MYKLTKEEEYLLALETYTNHIIQKRIDDIIGEIIPAVVEREISKQKDITVKGLVQSRIGKEVEKYLNKRTFKLEETNDSAN